MCPRLDPSPYTPSQDPSHRRFHILILLWQDCKGLALWRLRAGRGQRGASLCEDLQGAQQGSLPNGLYTRTWQPGRWRRGTLLMTIVNSIEDYIPVCRGTDPISGLATCWSLAVPTSQPGVGGALAVFTPHLDIFIFVQLWVQRLPQAIPGSLRSHHHHGNGQVKMNTA